MCSALGERSGVMLVGWVLLLARGVALARGVVICPAQCASQSGFPVECASESGYSVESGL